MNRSADSVVLLRNMIETFSAAFLKNHGKEMDFAKRLTRRRWLDRNFAAFDALGDTIGIGKR